MSKRPTIQDLSRAAGVSAATVDRVLNGRAKVREETAKRVLEAANRIGYHAAGLISYRMEEARPLLRIGFVLLKERQAFYKAFRTEAEAALAGAIGVRGRAEFRFARSQSPADFAELLDSLAGKVDFIAAVAVSHTEVTRAVERAQDAGTPCFALLNDFAQGVRQSYVGLNNMKVGRTAGYMLATAIHDPGKVAVIVGGHRWHGHELRETGCRSYLREYAPGFTVLDTLVNLETRQLTYEATLDLLKRHPDLRGIYCAGGGMEGAIAALREARRPGEVKMVVHELTPESRLALADRYVAMVIRTPLRQLCQDVVSLAQRARDKGHEAMPGQHFLEPDLFLPESV